LNGSELPNGNVLQVEVSQTYIIDAVAAQRVGTDTNTISSAAPSSEEPQQNPSEEDPELDDFFDSL
jgi:hypothetical protein